MRNNGRDYIAFEILISNIKDGGYYIKDRNKTVKKYPPFFANKNFIGNILEG